jgi:hypothetical protein
MVGSGQLVNILSVGLMLFHIGGSPRVHLRQIHPVHGLLEGLRMGPGPEAVAVLHGDVEMEM